MKATVIRYLNDIVSLTVLTLMAVALIAGQADATEHAVSNTTHASQATSIRHNGE
jgi:hypothetical protein